MDCQQFQLQLDAYCEERLDGPERNAFREHLAACPACRTHAIAHDPTLMFAAAPAQEADPQAIRSCVDAVSTLIRQDRLKRRLHSPRRVWLAAAAALLVVFVGSVFWRYAPLAPAGSGATPTAGPVVASAPAPAPPPRVEVDMTDENLRVYQFSDAGDENTAVYFIVNEAMEL